MDCERAPTLPLGSFAATFVCLAEEDAVDVVVGVAGVEATGSKVVPPRLDPIVASLPPLR